LPSNPNRYDWRIHTWTGHDLNEIVALVTPVVAGWMNYGRFYRSQLYPLLRRVNTYLMRCGARSTSGCALQEVHTVLVRVTKR
jgi:hypothetical protein